MYVYVCMYVSIYIYIYMYLSLRVCVSVVHFFPCNVPAVAWSHRLWASISSGESVDLSSVQTMILCCRNGADCMIWHDLATYFTRVLKTFSGRIRLQRTNLQRLHLLCLQTIRISKTCRQLRFVDRGQDQLLTGSQ